MPYKLLLADDSLTIQKVVELVLTPENFEIRAFNDGEQALNAMESFKPDIILADIEMPKLNGYQLCEKIKNDMATSAIPVILLAGAFEPFDEEYAKSVFADDFIIKPFESQELISKVKSLLVGFEQSKKAEPEEAKEEIIDEELLAVTEDAPEATVELAVSATPQTQEETKWDEEIPIAEEKVEDVMVDEEYEAETALSVETKGFKEELAEALKVSDELGVKSYELKEVELPAKEEIYEIIKQTIDEKVSSLISSDILPTVRTSIEQTISSSATAIIEDVTRELVKELLGSLRGEIDAVIKRIVPEVAETLIKKEIEKITSEINQ
jgi:DNA-binding response OmpR family regulator